VPEAIEKYRVLAAQVFSERKGPGKDGIFKASNLEKAIKTIVEERLDNAEERMWVDSGVCKTYDLLYSSNDLANLSLVDSYVLYLQSSSTKSLCYFVLGVQLQTQATIARSGKRAVLPLLHQSCLSVFLLETPDSRKNSLMLLWVATILCDTLSKKLNVNLVPRLP
jgi:hypothetical protein